MIIIFTGPVHAYVRTLLHFIAMFVRLHAFWRVKPSCGLHCLQSYAHIRTSVHKRTYYVISGMLPDPVYCPNDYCGRFYTGHKRKWSLNRHMTYSCGIDPQFQCIHCAKRFTVKANMKRHIISIHNVHKSWWFETRLYIFPQPCR